MPVLDIVNYIKEPVNITLFSGVPLDNSYENHPFFADFKGVSTIYGGGTLPSDKTWRFIFRRFIFNCSSTHSMTLTKRYILNTSNGLIADVVINSNDCYHTYFDTPNYLQVTFYDGVKSDYLFYFVTNVEKVSINNTTYRLSLELDVIGCYSNEILTSLYGRRILTGRKHCRRLDETGVLKCGDIMSFEDITTNFKPSKIERIEQILPFLGQTPSSGELFKYVYEGLKWVYVLFDTHNEENVGASNIGISLPYGVVCFPLLEKGKTLKIYTGVGTSATLIRTYTGDELLEIFDNTYVLDTKVSVLPPFNPLKGAPDVIITVTGSNDISINFTKFTSGSLGAFTAVSLTVNTNKYLMLSDVNTNKLLNGFLIVNYNNSNYLTLKNIGLYNNPTTMPTVDDKYVLEPKLYVEPITTYTIYSPWGDNYDLPVAEIIENGGANGDASVNPYTVSIEVNYIFTPYPSDNSLETYIKVINILSDSNHTINKLSYIGKTSKVTPDYKYIMATDVYKNFIAIQGATYNLNKGFGIASDVISYLGSGLGAGVGSAQMDFTEVAKSGTQAVKSALSIAKKSISYFTDKKDMVNTPDNIKNTGNNIIKDILRYKNEKIYPLYSDFYKTISSFLVVTKPQENEMNKFKYFFYWYGYQVKRYCVFNDNLSYTTNNTDYDDQIFNRTLFNYIQFDEDITSLLTEISNPVIKNKIATIFMNGIRLWTFFNFKMFDNDFIEHELQGRIGQYYLRSEYDNSEIYESEA